LSQNLHSKSINEIIDDTWNELVRDHKFLPHSGKQNVDTLIQVIEAKIEKELSEMQSPPFTALERESLRRKKDCIIRDEIERYRQYFEQKSEKDAENATASKACVSGEQIPRPAL
jgi:hypothetical protein